VLTRISVCTKRMQCSQQRRNRQLPSYVKRDIIRAHNTSEPELGEIKGKFKDQSDPLLELNSITVHATQ